MPDQKDSQRARGKAVSRDREHMAEIGRERRCARHVSGVALVRRRGSGAAREGARRGFAGVLDCSAQASDLGIDRGEAGGRVGFRSLGILGAGDHSCPLGLELGQAPLRLGDVARDY
jgi:hypothetical protein